MIERGDANLLAWLKTVANDAAIGFDLPPLATPAALAINAYLFEIDRQPTVTAARSPFIEVRLSYLISVAGEIGAAHALLGRLLESALAGGQFEIELGATVTATWSAFARPPSPAFIVRVPVTYDRGLPVAPRVTAPARVDTSAVQTIAGRVQSTNGQPLVGAVVQIAALGRSTLTTLDGSFALGGVPVDVPVAVLAQAKGVSATVDLPPHAPPAPVIVTIPLES
jgi:hypothetical protein